MSVYTTAMRALSMTIGGVQVSFATLARVSAAAPCSLTGSFELPVIVGCQSRGHQPHGCSLLPNPGSVSNDGFDCPATIGQCCALNGHPQERRMRRFISVPLTDADRDLGLIMLADPLRRPMAGAIVLRAGFQL